MLGGSTPHSCACRQLLLGTWAIATLWHSPSQDRAAGCCKTLKSQWAGCFFFTFGGFLAWFVLWIFLRSLDLWIFVWSIGAVGDSQYPVNPVSVKNEHIGSYQHVVSLLQMFGSTFGPWSQLQQPSVFGIVRRCKTWDASPMYAYFDLTYLNYHEFSRMLSQSSSFFAHSERSSLHFPSISLPFLNFLKLWRIGHDTADTLFR